MESVGPVIQLDATFANDLCVSEISKLGITTEADVHRVTKHDNLFDYFPRTFCKDQNDFDQFGVAP